MFSFQFQLKNSFFFLLFGLKSMNLYYIWANFFSCELKNTIKILKQTLEIRNMNPKNATKMINIQKSYSVHIVSIWSNQYSSVQFGPIRSYLVHSVHYSSIRSNSIHSVLFSPCRLVQSTLALFGPHWSYSVHFGPIRSILFTLVLFGPFCRLWFYFVLFGLFYPL